MNRVHIKTYGCQMNQRDSEQVAQLLCERGYAITANENEADIVLLNTCSIREQAEQKALNKAAALAARKRKQPQFIYGIMGCMAQNRQEDILDQLPDLDLLSGTHRFHRIPQQLDNIRKSLLAQGPRPSTLVDTEQDAEHPEYAEPMHGQSSKVSVLVNIMHGCNMNCAYCVVPKTRGPERARPMELIVEEVRQRVGQGAREVTLLGQIVNQYGLKEMHFKDGKSPFVQLLERINAIENLQRIRFTSPHPVGFRQDLIECYASVPKLCEHVHLPLQSGSNAILKAMRRPYTCEKFKRIVAALRAVQKDIYLSTDIIVGFPGESEADFQQTLEAFRTIGFDSAFIFKYSPRPKTPAEALGDPVAQEIKEQRNQELLEILAEQSKARNARLIGTEQEVLVEAPARRGENQLVGRNRGERKVVFPGPKRLIGECMRVIIRSASHNTLRGEPVLLGDPEPEPKAEPEPELKRAGQLKIQPSDTNETIKVVQKKGAGQLKIQPSDAKPSHKAKPPIHQNSRVKLAPQPSRKLRRSPAIS